MVLGILDVHIQENEIKPLSLITYKNQLQMEQRTACKTWNCEITRRKHRGILKYISLSDDNMDKTFKKRQVTRAKINKKDNI
jgi:hypothetical protein